MKIALVNQPICQVLPSGLSSVRACSYKLAASLAQNPANQVFIYGRQQTVNRELYPDIETDYVDRDIHFRFLPSPKSNQLLSKAARAFYQYVFFAPIFNRGMKPAPSQANWRYPRYARRVAEDIGQFNFDIIHIQHSSQFLPALRKFNPKSKITLCLSTSIGALLVAAATPAHAELFRQDFELRVNQTQPATDYSDKPYIEAGIDPAYKNLPPPPIGTVGRGYFVYDTANINYVDSHPSSDITVRNYFLQPNGNPAFSDFSLNFFNRTYTQTIADSNSRSGNYLYFERNAAGQYTPTDLFLATSDGSSVIRFYGIQSNQGGFRYRPGPQGYDYSFVNSASGSIVFSAPEPVPEPPTTIAASLAIGFGYLFHRRRKQKSKLD